MAIQSRTATFLALYLDNVDVYCMKEGFRYSIDRAYSFRKNGTSACGVERAPWRR